MKKSGIKGFVLGFTLCAVLFGLAGTALAAGSTQTLQDVLVGGIRIVIDGQELHPTDASGNPVNPMIYNGTTYLPVRAVATALGKAVYWDGPTYTVYLGNMDGKLEYPTVMLKDMTSIGENVHTTDSLTDNYGNRYGSAIDNASTNLEYLLNMKYSSFKGTLFVPEGVKGVESGYLTIEADGRLLYTSPQMTASSSPVKIDVSVKGYNDVKIAFSNGYWSRHDWEQGALCLADAGFYQ